MIRLEYKNVIFKCSLSFIPLPLSKFGVTFELAEGKKGYFPHFFNTSDNENYEGVLPELKHYGVNEMSPANRTALIKWHLEKTVNNYVFNFKKELYEYCLSDVNILTESVIKFCELFLNETEVDAFAESNTIAACCHIVYRRNYLKENTIPILSNSGYNHGCQSEIALKYLKWLEHDEQIEIQYRNTGGEKRF